jgi:hypothetical protein
MSFIRLIFAVREISRMDTKFKGKGYANPYPNPTSYFYGGATPAVAPELEYDRLTFLLKEVATPPWQAALAPDQKERLLLPYRLAQHATGLRLGLIPRLNPHLRQIRITALALLLEDFYKLPGEKIEAARLQPLLDFFKTELVLVQNDYRVFPEAAALPAFEVLDLQLKIEVLRAAQALLKEAESRKIVETTAEFRQVKESYAGRVKELRALEATRRAEEARRQREEAQTRGQTRWPEAEVKSNSSPVLTPTEPAPANSPELVGPAQPAKQATPLKLKFKWENIWGALLSEITLRTLLYLGALMVVVAAAVFITINWNQFPPVLQVSMLLGVDLAFYGGGVFVLKKLKLPWAGLTFIAVGSAILPFCLYGYTRPEILGLSARMAWFVVSLAALACYLPVAWWLREKLFGYMVCLAALNAFCTTLYQFQVAPEWIAVAGIPFAAGLVWCGFRLKDNAKFGELADPPFWLGQVTIIAITFGLLSYGLYAGYTQVSFPSLEWALGSGWFLAMVFYAWCAYIFPANRVIYMYGTSLAGLVVACLILHKLAFITSFYGLVLWLLGLGYVLAEALPRLVEKLNENPDGANISPWRFSEVFNLKQPLTVFGCTLVLASPILASTPLSLTFYLGLVALFLLLATLLYNWRYLA